MKLIYALLFPLLCLQGVIITLTERHLRRLCLLPWCAGMIALAVSGALTMVYYDQVSRWLMQLFLSSSEGGGRSWLAVVQWLTSAGVLILGAVLSGIGSLLVVVVSSGFLLERFVAHVIERYRDAGEFAHDDAAHGAGFLRTLCAEGVRGALMTLASLIVLFGLVVPWLSLPLMLLSFLLSGTAIFDLVFALRGLSLAARLRGSLNAWPVMIACGATFSALALVPLGGLLLLPCVYFGAARVSASLLSEKESSLG